MVSRRFQRAGFLVVLSLMSYTTALAAATVNYEGFLYSSGGAPVNGGFVIAGTFAPGFNVHNYFDTFGDGFGNALSDSYDRAVATGTFRPIGSGVSTIAGFFSGTGTTNDTPGTSIYLFGFEHSPTTSLYQALATSSDPSYLVPTGSGITAVNASLANQFAFGKKLNGGIGLVGVPIPEPSTSALASLAAIVTGVSLRRRARKGSC
jgi:hypothetical protein